MVLEGFAKLFLKLKYKDETQAKLFPFTEPSLEVDIACQKDKNRLIVGEGSDWLEVLGAEWFIPGIKKC